MAIQELQAATRTGRIAAHFREIEDARARGVKWKQIREAIGADLGIEPGDPAGELKLRRAYHNALVQIEKGKLRAGPPPGVSGPTGLKASGVPAVGARATPAKPAGGFKDVLPEG